MENLEKLLKDNLLIVFAVIVVFALIVYAIVYYSFSQRSIVHNSAKYKVVEYPNLLTSEECDQIIAYSKTKPFEESSVLNYNKDSPTRVDNQFRKCKQTWAVSNDNPVLKKLSDISVKLTGIPAENQEMAQIAFYTPGGKFDAHYDACDGEKEYCHNINRNGGERLTTLLLYLNDDFEGGETEFVNIGVKIKPKKGMAILFYNVDGNEEIIRDSMHKAHELKTGEKWICTIWSHVKKYV